MKRLTLCIALFASSLLLANTPARAQDKIYVAGKTDKPLLGIITADTPAGITYRPQGAKPATATETIPAGNIVQVDYRIKDQDKYGDTIEWNSANNALRRAREAAKPAERKKDVDNALEKFGMLAPKVTDDKALNRQVQFDLAELLTLQVEDDPKQLDAAIDALKKFKSKFGDGWQLVRATKLLVRLLEQKGDEAGAQMAYTELADNEAAPKQVRQEFGILVVRYLLRKDKHADAAKRARALEAAMAPADPQKLQMKVYLAACDIAAKKYDTVESDLKKVLESNITDQNADQTIKAMARNTLGDLYRAQGKADKAFWEYLWVDVHYNQDREELARALYHLSKLFAEVKQDKVRARECLDRLSDEGQFGRMEYHLKAKAERDGASEK